MKTFFLFILFSLPLSLSGNDLPSDRSVDRSQTLNKIDFSMSSRDLIDTLSTGLYDTVLAGIRPGDAIVELYRAPGNLTLNKVGIDIGQWNSDGASISLSVEVFRQNNLSYPFSLDAEMYGYEVIEENGWLGFAHSNSNDSVAYADPNIQAGLVWNNFSSGVGVCSATPEVDNGQPVLGDKVLPISGEAILQKPENNSIGTFFVDLSSDGGADFVKDEYFIVSVTYLVDGAGDPDDASSTVYINAGESSNIYPRPGLKYSSRACSGPSGEHGWHVLSSSWNFQCVVNITGDIAPYIELYHIGLSSSEGLPDPVPTWTEIKIMTIIKDLNPSGGDDGVETGILNWQLNSLTADTMSSIMNTAFNLVIQEYVYHTEMPGNTNGTTVYWWVSAEDVEGNVSAMNKRSLLLGTLSTTEEIVPNEIKLLGNYPNPFNPFTNILFHLNRDSHVNLKIFDSRGRLVDNILNENKFAGHHAVSWDGKNQNGVTVPSGIYIYKLESNQKHLSGKMMLLK